MVVHLFDNFPIMDIDDIYILRAIETNDDVEYYHYMNHDEVKKYVANEEIPKTLERASRDLQYWGSMFAKKNAFYWAIARKSDNALVGTCGFNSWNFLQKRCEISYDMSYEFWGQGIMNRALDKICNFAFDNMQVNRIQATVACPNKKSIKLLRRLRFKQEGLLRKFYQINEKTYDGYMMSKIKGE
jgi:[ribosomal protein S5]-alanine N-acetyltransferase